MGKRAYWLVKSEPAVYAYSDLERERRTEWTGVRNFEARNHLRAMRAGDLVLFYHSTGGKQVVGIARVAEEATADPTAPGEDWACVVLEPVTALASPVPLEAVRRAPALAKMQLVTRSRLSVTPVTAAEFSAVLKLGKTRPPS